MATECTISPVPSLLVCKNMKEDEVRLNDDEYAGCFRKYTYYPWKCIGRCTYTHDSNLKYEHDM